MSLQAPPVLPNTAYLRPIRLQAGGVRALTHLALVKNAEGTPQRAYVKQFCTDTPRALFNEWFGYTLMSALCVPQPQAALMQAPVPGTQAMAWSFVSFEALPRSDGTPKEIYQPHDDAQLRLLSERLLACQAFAALTAADQLCMNGDRNLGNVVFTGTRSFVAIDHSDILGGPAWSRDELIKPTQWSEAKLLAFCEDIKPLTPGQRNALVAAADVAVEAFYTQWHPLRQALGHEPDALLALDALWWRSLPLAQWFRERLQLIM